MAATMRAERDDSAIPDALLRRERRALLALVLIAAASSRAAAADHVPRVAVLAPSTRAKEQITLAPFYTEMGRLGWIEGRNVEYERAFANDHHDTLPRLAAELVRQSPDVIFAPPTVAALAAKRSTRSIPVVFAAVTDPVALGLVNDLARPGANVTGVASVTGTLAPKRMELLRETLPTAQRIGVVMDPNDASSEFDRVALETAAKRLGLALIKEALRTEGEITSVFASFAAARVDAVLPTASTIAFNLRVPLCAAALRARLPLVAHRTEFVDAGALLAYSSSQDEQLRRGAQIVDKILRGAKPSDIPIEQPTVFELVINLRTARALGIAVPSSVRLRADRVLE